MLHRFPVKTTPRVEVSFQPNSGSRLLIKDRAITEATGHKANRAKDDPCTQGEAPTVRTEGGKLDWVDRMIVVPPVEDGW